MKKLKILIYGDQNLNILDGSAVWMSSLVNILTQDMKVDVDILLKTSVKRNVILTNIEKIDQVKLINPFESYKDYEFQNKQRLNPNEAAELIEKIDLNNNYHVIITRGKEVTNFCLNYEFSKKQIPYITDFTHDKNLISDEEKGFLDKCYKTFPYIFVQTDEMSEYLAELLSVSNDKFILLPPTVPDITEIKEFEITDQTFVYSGKFSKLWGIEELLEVFKRMSEENKNINLNIAGDKFQADLNDKKDEIIKFFNNNNKVNWIGGVSRADSLKLIKESDVGFAFRSEKIDHDRSLELSTKVIEYGALGKPVILRRTRPYEKLLGKDYPLFVDENQSLFEIMSKSIEDKRVYKDAANTCFEIAKKYQISVVSKNILKLLWQFNTENETILFAGHDFKFLKPYIDHCNNNKSINVLIDKWEGHANHNEEESRSLLAQADTVFCEWGLGNLEFYSNNLLKGQKLIVRLHRQEIETNYLNLVNWENVHNIIVVSAHMFEEFSRRKQVPREKLIIIPNMVNLSKFKYNDSKESNFNIGMLGMLPKLKRPDRALDIFEKVWKKNQKYKLFIKSKMPEELEWLMNRPEEKEYYDALFERINQAPWKENVVFEQHGDDVVEWFSKINYILSVSDIESFHLAPMEGIATGSVPVIFNWDGARTIYPKEVIVNDTDTAAQFIIENQSLKDIKVDMDRFINRFSEHRILKSFDELLGISGEKDEKIK